MSITVADSESEETYVAVPAELRDEMRRVFGSALADAENHLATAKAAGEPLSYRFEESVNSVRTAAAQLDKDGCIPFVGGNSPGEDAGRNNDFSVTLLSAYGFPQTPHKTANPHSVRGFESLQPLADFMHGLCIYT